MEVLYKDEYAKLIYSDAFKYLESLPDQSIDMIITDPPYFLSNDGISNSGGKVVSVNKGDWDKKSDSEANIFYEDLLIQFQRVLKANGSICIFGSMHNIYKIGFLLQKHNFKILNNITWRKTNPSPNLSHRMFTHSTETILWAKRKSGRQIFHYELMKKENNNKQMTDVWETPTIQKIEKRYGYHPTQKPLSLLIRIIKATTNQDSLILDPFIGSGTTAVAGKILNRRVIGVDFSKEFLKIAIERVKSYKTEKIGNIK